MALGPLISIAVNNGIALGGGAEFNWACDIRLAGESAVYGQVEGRVGGLPGCGGSVRLARLVGKGKAIEVLVTGRPFSAREMQFFGAVNQVYPDDKLREEAIKFAARIAENATSAMLACKQSINQQGEMRLRDALKNETRISRQSVHTGDGLVESDKVIEVYERGGDSYEAYKFEVPPKEYPY
jgi:enoyl-CoA hydratase/carnithine racemase